MKEGVYKKVVSELALLRDSLKRLKDLESNHRDTGRENSLSFDMETLMAKIATSYIKVTHDDLDNQIYNTVKMVGKFNDVDRCYVCFIDENNYTINKEYEWCKDNIKSLVGVYSQVSWKWLVDRFVKCSHLYISNIRQLPFGANKEKNFCHSLGVKSILVMPLIVDKRLAGFFGFNSETMGKTCSDEAMKVFRFVGDIMSRAVEQLGISTVKEENSPFEGFFIDKTSTSLWLVDMEELEKEIYTIRSRGVTHFTLFFEKNYEYFKYLTRLPRIITINDATLKLFDAKNKEEAIRCIENIFFDDTFEYLKDVLISFCEDKKEFKKVLFANTFNGREIRLLISILKKPGRCLVSATDLSALGEKDEALNESEKRYKYLLSVVTDYVYTVYLDNSRVLSTVHGPGCLSVTGYAAWEYESDSNLWYDMIYEKDRDYVISQLDKVLQGISVPAIEHRIVHKNGAIKWVLNRPIQHINNEKQVIAYDGLVSDITERKEAELLLENERDKFQQYLKISGVMFIVIGIDETVKLINKKGCEILGYDEQDIVGKNWFDNFFSHANTETFKEFFKQTMDGKKSDYESFESSLISKDGKTKFISWHNSVLKDNAGNITGVLSSGEDITKRKQLETQLYQAQKMEAIGQLAGGVAHDFNNIISAIGNYTFLLQKYINTNSTATNYAEQIQASLDRATHLTQSLLAFSRKQIINPKPINLVHLIKTIEKFLERIISENIELKTFCEEEEIVVIVDRTQMEMVLINLATNARDAMPEGGLLQINTSIEVIDKEYVKRHNFGSIGKYALISVNDTGQGMDLKVRQKVFEPFFTTKEVGKGTGLGLSTVYGIIKQHNGFINVYSELEVGTSFKIYIPLSNSECAYNNNPVRNAQFETGTETVLVVEDDRRLRLAVCNVLKEAGYNVVEAKDGVEAVEKFSACIDKVAIAVIDVIMPGVDGKQVAKKLIELKSNLKVLFTSGYTYDIIHQKGILDDDINYLSKPFNTSVFLKKLRQILNG